MQNLKEMVIRIVYGALGTVPKNPEKVNRDHPATALLKSGECLKDFRNSEQACGHFGSSEKLLSKTREKRKL